jgi:hypothetical protein
MWVAEKEHGRLRPFKALKTLSSRYGELAAWMKILKESIVAWGILKEPRVTTPAVQRSTLNPHGAIGVLLKLKSGCINH